MWFIGVEVEQETSAPPPKKNPGSAPGVTFTFQEMKEENFASVTSIAGVWFLDSDEA